MVHLLGWAVPRSDPPGPCHSLLMCAGVRQVGFWVDVGYRGYCFLSAWAFLSREVGVLWEGSG